MDEEGLSETCHFWQTDSGRQGGLALVGHNASLDSSKPMIVELTLWAQNKTESHDYGKDICEEERELAGVGKK